MPEQIREALEKAFDASTSEEGGSASDSTEPVGAAPEAAASGEPSKTPEDTGVKDESKPEDQKAGDEDSTGGEGKPDAGKPADGKPAATEGKPEAGAGKDRKDDTKTAPPVAAGKAPDSWNPEARQEWDKLPEKVRNEVNRRELQIQQALSNTQNSRQLAQDFRQVVEPFMPLIAAQRSTPIQAVKNLMNTAAGLHMGTDLQKAQIVHEIMKNHKVSVELLDTLLSGETPDPAKTSQQDIARLVETQVNARLAPMEQQRAQQQRQVEAQVEQTIDQFSSDPANEFYNDVWEDMADILERTAARKQSISLKDAYDKACRLNPQVDKIIEQRKAAASAKGRDAERSRKASSTIAGGPAGGQRKPNMANRTDAINAAFDMHAKQ